MQNGVVRAPNGRVITNDYIAEQYNHHHLMTNTGSQTYAKDKSSFVLPAFAPVLLDYNAETLAAYVDDLFAAKSDPCFIEIAKNQLLRKFNHLPTENWLKGLNLKTKTNWDVYYYYLILSLLAFSKEYGPVHLANLNFKMHDELSGTDTRKLNGLRSAVGIYTNPDAALLASLTFTSGKASSSFTLCGHGFELQLGLDHISNLVVKADSKLSLMLVRLYLNEVLYKNNIRLKAGDTVLLGIILYMAVITLS
ncbi:hypothetical protein [Thiomicrospira sp. ALE5]|uniref:hypothetical protein n=1 Tax=Thiomicrospira sp. ALE5 TaxID=748650 RepID=UPI0008E7F6DC|nr:hypothetical protein [Thiomicrospira sp. ALE5]SFR55774.1 hypothetical protein SAMN03092900_1177 [Thiomicrospira sp. ALE5]